MAVDGGASFWRQVFRREGPVEVEIGPGTGAFLIPAAQQNPGVNYLGIEASRSRADRLEATIRQLVLPNVIVLHAPAQCVIAHCIPPGSVQAYHVYFPDPWWKRRHHRRRLLTPHFARLLETTLVTGGRVYLATDVELVWELALGTFLATPNLLPDPTAQPVRPQATRFERKARQRGAMVRDLVLRKLPDVHERDPFRGEAEPGLCPGRPDTL